MLIADIFMVGQVVCVKISSEYVSTNFICFARSLITLLILVGSFCFSKSSTKLKDLFKTGNFRVQMIRSCAGLAAIYGFYYGIHKLTLSLGTLLFYTFPLFVPIISRIWLGVQIIPRMWWGIGIAFFGIIFILHPESNQFNPLVFIPVFGAICIAVSGVATRVLHYTDSWKTILLYYFTFSTIVTAIIFLSLNDLSIEIFNIKSLVFITFVGIFTALFQIFYTLAAKYAPMRLLSPFIYMSFVFGSVVEFFIWNSTVNLEMILGFIIIVTGTVLMVLLYPKDDLKFVSKKTRSKRKKF